MRIPHANSNIYENLKAKARHAITCANNIAVEIYANRKERISVYMNKISVKRNHFRVRKDRSENSISFRTCPRLSGISCFTFLEKESCGRKFGTTDVVLQPQEKCKIVRGMQRRIPASGGFDYS